MTAGHSYGELAALAVAGVFDPSDLLALSAARGEAIVDAAAAGDDPGTMAAVSSSRRGGGPSCSHAHPGDRDRQPQQPDARS